MAFAHVACDIVSAEGEPVRGQESDVTYSRLLQREQEMKE